MVDTLRSKISYGLRNRRNKNSFTAVLTYILFAKYGYREILRRRPKKLQGYFYSLDGAPYAAPYRGKSTKLTSKGHKPVPLVLFYEKNVTHVKSNTFGVFYQNYFLSHKILITYFKAYVYYLKSVYSLSAIPS